MRNLMPIHDSFSAVIANHCHIVAYYTGTDPKIQRRLEHPSSNFSIVFLCNSGVGAATQEIEPPNFRLPSSSFCQTTALSNELPYASVTTPPVFCIISNWAPISIGARNFTTFVSFLT